MEKIVSIAGFLIVFALLFSVLWKAKRDLRRAQRILALTIKSGRVNELLWRCFDRTRSTTTARYRWLVQQRDQLAKEYDRLIM